MYVDEYGYAQCPALAGTVTPVPRADGVGVSLPSAAATTPLCEGRRQPPPTQGGSRCPTPHPLRPPARQRPNPLVLDCERLDVYRVALEFQILVPALAKGGDAALRDQLRRAALSIVLNIAEGSSQWSRPQRAAVLPHSAWIDERVRGHRRCSSSSRSGDNDHVPASSRAPATGGSDVDETGPKPHVRLWSSLSASARSQPATSSPVGTPPPRPWRGRAARRRWHRIPWLTRARCCRGAAFGRGTFARRLPQCSARRRDWRAGADPERRRRLATRARAASTWNSSATGTRRAARRPGMARRRVLARRCRGWMGSEHCEPPSVGSGCRRPSRRGAAADAHGRLTSTPATSPAPA